MVLDHFADIQRAGETGGSGIQVRAGEGQLESSITAHRQAGYEGIGAFGREREQVVEPRQAVLRSGR